MKTRLPTETPSDQDTAPQSEQVLITAQGVARYADCHRTWWLADYLEYQPSDELVAARETLASRRQLARILTIAGGAMIGLAVLIFVVAAFLAG